MQIHHIAIQCHRYSMFIYTLKDSFGVVIKRCRNLENFIDRLWGCALEESPFSSKDFKIEQLIPKYYNSSRAAEFQSALDNLPSPRKDKCLNTCNGDIEKYAVDYISNLYEWMKSQRLHQA